MASTTRRRTKTSTGGSGQTARSNDFHSETERYRQAVEDALQQLDWAIGYLHGIHKTEISRALARNRSYIRQQLMGRAEEPLPTQQTDET
ncbi:MAG TPA: hypothetical protein VE570_16055 [Thermoleophilaceae bacterium]|jgi:hypothetical protein|nr:hypothetical protein [Thermoleophilaceae bacterium]